MKGIPFVVFGASGHAKVVIDIALLNRYAIDWIIDDAPKVEKIFGLDVWSTDNPEVILPGNFDFVVAIGDNTSRESVFERLLFKGGRARTLIHPSSLISPTARIMDGTVCCAGAIVNPDATIGSNCIVNTAASIDHDCRVGDHSHVCPGVRLAGNVIVGSRTMIGTGAVVLPGIRIGSDCIIGAGSLVNRDIPDGALAFGVPAKVKKTMTFSR